MGITEEVLLAWLLREPQTLVWWTTLYRLTSAELGEYCYFQIFSHIVFKFFSNIFSL